MNGAQPGSGLGSRDREVSGRWRRRLGLLLLVVAALGLRVWYLSYDLTLNRFWDERYSLENVASILEEGTLRPAKAYYPSPVFNVPAAAVVAAARAMGPASPSRGGFSSREIFLVRLLQAVVGCLGLLLIYGAGRLLFSPATGLVAALALAFLPWHVHASGYFKPDALVATAVLLVLYTSLRALGEDRLGAYLLAGVAVTLAASGKLTGVLAAAGLATGVLVLGRRGLRRRLACLAAAGATAFALFVALNPYWSSYLQMLSGLRRDYAMRAGWEEMKHLDLPARMVELFAGPYVHGRVAALIAAVALLFLVRLAMRRDTDRLSRARAVTFLTLPLVYPVVYVFQTPYFKPNNFLLLMPYSCLLIAWGLVAGWRWTSRRWALLGSRPARTAAGLLAVVWIATPGFLYVYRSLVPTTLDLALRIAAPFSPSPARVLFVERVPDPPPTWEGARNSRGLASQRTVDRLDEVAAGRLNAADGEIFVAGRRGAGEFYRRRIERVPAARVFELAPKWFRLRGPRLVAVRHPRRLIGEPEQLHMGRCGQACRSFVVPPRDGRGTHGSLLFWVGRAKRALRAEMEVEATLAGEQLPVHPAGGRRFARYYVTDRFRLPPEEQEVRFEWRSEWPVRRLAAQLHRWGPPRRKGRRAGSVEEAAGSETPQIQADPASAHALRRRLPALPSARPRSDPAPSRALKSPTGAGLRAAPAPDSSRASTAGMSSTSSPAVLK